MRCKIADLIVDVPKTGGIAPHFRDYLYFGEEKPDIIIDASLYDASKYSAAISFESLAYLESGRQFYAKLLFWGGLHLHASAVEYQGKAYLFSAPSGTGKSTHTRLWQQKFDGEAHVFNDDKTPMRCIDGIWYAYGTPWCGKDHININTKVPVAGICFLKQAQENRIRQLGQAEALTRLIPQTIYRFAKLEKMDMMLSLTDKLLRQIPVFELENRPEPEAARLSYETMRRKAEELGL